MSARSQRTHQKAAAEFYNQDRSGYPPGTYAAIESDQAANAIAMLSDRETRWVDASPASAKELKTAIQHGSSIIVSTQKEVPESFTTAAADPNSPPNTNRTTSQVTPTCSTPTASPKKASP